MKSDWVEVVFMGPLTDSEKQLIIQMENSGSLLKDIAATLHRNPITVRSYLTSQGYEPTNKKYSSEEKEQIISLFKSGLSCSEIARQINRSANGVTHFLTAEGYDTSSPLIITEDEKRIAIKVFRETKSCAKAAEAIGHSHDGVWSMLKREGFDTQKSVYVWLTNEQVANIRAMYQEGYTAAEILPLYKDRIATENSIIKIVKDAGIVPRSTGYRNIILHENFFDEIDTEEKAYVIGLLMADGCVLEGKRGRTDSWTITLKAEDRYMLERIKELVGSDNKVNYQKSKETYILTVSSQHMVEALAKYNITPRKSKTISFPYGTFPSELCRHVIRGLFDGDGCISGRRCSFIGNAIVIPQIQDILIEQLGINKTKVHETNPDVWNFVFSAARDVEAFYHYLYDDATIYLTRKKARFEKLPYCVSK